MIALAVIGGMGFAAGLCLFVSGLTPTERPERRTRPALPQVNGMRLALAVGCGLAIAFVTRWPVAAIGGGVAGWFAPELAKRDRSARSEARSEAIASWCELLRDAAGTSRGIEGILVATASSAPGAIRPEVQRMARRLEFETIDVALDHLADELAHPLGDLVVTALRLASTAGSSRVRQVLDDLASAAHQEASMQRRVDVARQRPRSTMRLVAGIVAAFIVGLLVFARDYLAPYGTPLGQLMLAAVVGQWALGFWWLARMGKLRTVPRYLARKVEQ